MLDHKFLELAAGIPSSFKLRHGTSKYILKKAVEPLLPRNILHRPKQGFAIPLDAWFRQDLKEMARKVILETEDGILDNRFLRTIWNQHQSGQYDRSALLWATLMFRKWHATFCD
jgi:asparagine synthase (glutamine-hydrolysing)